MMNPHKITAEFEKALCDYCCSPYAVAVDNCSNALFLALYYELNISESRPDKANMAINLDSDSRPIVTIPRHTYPSVACEIIHAGGRVNFDDSLFPYQTREGKLSGAYQLVGTNGIDSALRFTSNMYLHGCHMCLSFTGPFKHLKLGKGGAILTDNEHAYKWFKKARFSGRSECSYHDDNFDDNPVVGWNFYMPVETAARGLHMMPQFYDKDGKPKSNEDLCLPYPDLSRFKLWQ